MHRSATGNAGASRRSFFRMLAASAAALAAGAGLPALASRLATPPAPPAVTATPHPQAVPRTSQDPRPHAE